MNRRQFINKSVFATATIPVISMFSGCGSDSGSTNGLTTNTGVSSDIDTDVDAGLSQVTSLVSNLQALKEESDTTSSNSNNNLFATTSTSSVAARILLRSTTDEFSNDEKQVFTEYAIRRLENTYFPTSDIWNDYAEYNSISYSQFSSQFTKLTTALRLYEYEQNLAQSSLETSQASSISRDTFEDASLQSILDDLSSISFIGATTEFNSSIVTTQGYVGNATTKITELGLSSIGVEFAIASAAAIESVLKSISKQIDADVTLLASSETTNSIAALSNSIIEFMNEISFDKLGSTSGNNSISRANLSDDEANEVKLYLQNTSLQSQLSLLLVKMMDKYVTQISTEFSTVIKNSGSKVNVDFTSDEEAEKDALVKNLAGQSASMTTIGNILKELFSMMFDEANASIDSNQKFDESGTASEYSSLFAHTVIPQDELLSEELSSTFPTTNAKGRAMESRAFGEELIGAFTGTISDISTEITQELITEELPVLGLVDDAIDTVGGVADSAGNAVESAFDFTMQTTDYAYSFASQGLEYGYLFASKGEEVGVMADRILFMAVQIGVMADRIGEMADRIVYTETLIVYTEMIILEFGLLIYSTMNMITDGMLTALAIIFDREWYETDTSEDQTVTLIGDTMTQMMDNMQEYSLAVLANQVLLRESTQSADVNFAQEG